MSEQDFLSHLLVDIQKKFPLCIADGMEKKNYLGTSICVGIYISVLEGMKLHITSQLPVKWLLNIDSTIFIHIRSLNECSGCSIVKLPCIPSSVMTIGNMQDYSYLSNGDFRERSKILTLCSEILSLETHSFEVLKTFASSSGS